MDCPSEENLIRMKLDSIHTIQHLEFDLSNRQLIVFHLNEIELVQSSIKELNLGGELISKEASNQTIFEKETIQKKLLWTVLIVNLSFFVIEIITGLVSNSIGLVADSLDMLADSLVYGISLLAIGHSLVRKKNVAKVAGYLQIALASIGFIEVLRRVIGVEEIPVFSTMIIVSILALIANSACLFILQKSKSKEAHMKASMIFTSNDIIINSGVILAGILVSFFGSSIPDLIIGSLVFGIVLKGAIRILALSK